MLLKVTTGTVSNKHSFSDDASLQELQQFIADKTGIADYEQELLIGFPPTLLGWPIAPESKLDALGIKNGSVVTVRPNADRRALFSKLSGMGHSAAVIRECFALGVLDIDTCHEICQQLAASGPLQMVRKVIPADNSCLFAAIAFCAQPVHPADPMHYRRMVSRHILAHREEFSLDMLDGKDAAAYAQWITQTERWGGEVELSILAPLLSLEIAVVDIRTGRTYIYGQGQQAQRIYLLYDGVHYDALMVQGSGQTAFDSSDSAPLESAEQVAKELKAKRQFVDLAAGQLVCGECNKLLGGQADAVAHAKATGHQNFVQA